MTLSGRVQGVGFRYAVQRQAQTLGLSGWVRNLPDGRVEGEIEGESAVVERMLAWCRQGPPLAQVAETLVEEIPPTQYPPGFEIY